MNVVARCLHPLAKEEGLPASKSKDHAGNQEAQMELLRSLQGLGKRLAQSSL